jgi:hypothetical protein
MLNYELKISMSNNPEKRLADLQTGHPDKLVLYTVVKDVRPEYELEVHRILGHIRKQGEWFELTDELMNFMLNRIAETGYPFKVNNTFKIETETDKSVKSKVKRLSLREKLKQGLLKTNLISGDESLRSKLERRGILC